MLNHKAAELEAKILRHQRLYDAGMPEITDAEFDALVAQLRKEFPDSEVLDDLGSSFSKKTVQHANPMLSLDKVYVEDDLVSWVCSLGKTDLIVQPKYDGLAVSLVYQNNVLESASTRGDGSVGDEITTAIKFAASKLYGLNIPIKLPNTIFGASRVAIRGELLMPVALFNAHYAREYANPRNLIAGLAMRDTDHGPLYDARFIAYDYFIVGQQDTHQLSTKLNALSYAGFDTGQYEEVTNYRDVPRLAKQKWETPYEIDGVVFKANDPALRQTLGATAHHPRWAIAWKYQGQTGSTVLRDVEWEVSRTGTITPVAVFDPIALSGVVVSRATLHNYARFYQLPLHVGSVLQITRRGGVIPHVETAHGDSKTPHIASPMLCPSCGSRINGHNWPLTRALTCSQIRTCPGVLQERLRYWCKETGMLGIGPEFCQRFVEAHVVKTIVDLYRLDEAALLRAGFGLGQSRNILAEIDKTRTLDPVDFLVSLGIEGLGRTTAKKIVPFFNWETLEISAPVHKKRYSRRESAIQDGIHANADLIDTLLIYIRIEHPTVVSSEPMIGPFAGKKVVFTGALTDMDRSVAQDLVRQYGGLTPSSLTKDVDILVVGDGGKESQTTKKRAAIKYNSKGANIEIIDETEFSIRLAKILNVQPTE